MMITGNHLVIASIVLFIFLLICISNSNANSNSTRYDIEFFEPSPQIPQFLEPSPQIPQFLEPSPQIPQFLEPSPQIPQFLEPSPQIPQPPQNSKLGGVCITSDNCEDDLVCGSDSKQVCYLTEDTQCPEGGSFTHNGEVKFIDRNNQTHAYQVCCGTEAEINTKDLDKMKGICPPYQVGTKLLSYGADMDSSSLYNLLQDPHKNGYQFGLGRLNKSQLSFSACPMIDTKKVIETGDFEGVNVINDKYCIINGPKNDNKCPQNFDDYGKIQTIDGDGRSVGAQICCLSKSAATQRFSDTGPSSGNNICRKGLNKREGDPCVSDLQCPTLTVCRADHTGKKICKGKSLGETCKLVERGTHNCERGLECVCSDRFFMGESTKCPTKTVCSEGLGNTAECRYNNDCHWGNCVSYCSQFPSGSFTKGTTKFECKDCIDNPNNFECKRTFCNPSKLAGPDAHCFNDEECFGKDSKCIDHKCKERRPLGYPCKLGDSNEYDRCDDGLECEIKEFIEDGETIKKLTCIRAGIDQPPPREPQTICYNNSDFGKPDSACKGDIKQSCPDGYKSYYPNPNTLICRNRMRTKTTDNRIFTTDKCNEQELAAWKEHTKKRKKCTTAIQCNKGLFLDKEGKCQIRPDGAASIGANIEYNPAKNNVYHFINMNTGHIVCDGKATPIENTTILPEGCSYVLPKETPTTYYDPNKNIWNEIDLNPEEKVMCVDDKGLFLTGVSHSDVNKCKWEIERNRGSSISYLKNRDNNKYFCNGILEKTQKEECNLDNLNSDYIYKNKRIYNKLKDNNNIQNYQCIKSGKLTGNNLQGYAEANPNCKWDLVKAADVKQKVCSKRNSDRTCKEWGYKTLPKDCPDITIQDDCNKNSNCLWRNNKCEHGCSSLIGDSNCSDDPDCLFTKNGCIKKPNCSSLSNYNCDNTYGCIRTIFGCNLNCEILQKSECQKQGKCRFDSRRGTCN